MDTEKTTAPTAPYDWVREVNKALIQLDETPLLSSSLPPFPWESFSKKLAETFELPDLQISAAEWRWRTGPEVTEGLGEPLKPTALALSPLGGAVWWLMSDDALSTVMAWLLTKGADKQPFQQADFREAFYRFATLQVLNVYSQTTSLKALIPSITTGDIPTGDALCADISISCHGRSVWGRLVIPNDLRKAIKSHLAQSQVSAAQTPLAQDIEVTVHVEAGKTSLSLAEWKKVAEGDFLFLDSSGFDPENEKTKVVLTVGGKEILRGKIKKDKLKILEHPLYYEVDTAMANENHEELPPEDEGEFAEFEEGEFLEEEPLEEESHEEEPQEGAPPATGTQAPAENDELFEEIAEGTEEPPAAAAPKAPPPPTAAAAKGEAKGTGATTVAQPEGKVTAEAIPITLTVEVARLRMTVQNLLNLQPGNIIDLHVEPEQGVNLSVNGKLVGRGELLRIGETLGVRILELGK